MSDTTPTTTLRVPAHAAAQVVRRLIQAQSVERIARETCLPREAVRAITGLCGHPHVRQMRTWAETHEAMSSIDGITLDLSDQVRPAEPAQGVIEQLLAAAAAPTASTRRQRLAARIRQDLARLTQMGRDDEAHAAIRAELAQLETRRAELRAQLHGPVEATSEVCRECGRTFASRQALGVHRTRTHRGEVSDVA